jgi:hypothetical protein
LLQQILQRLIEGFHGASWWSARDATAPAHQEPIKKVWLDEKSW